MDSLSLAKPITANDISSFTAESEDLLPAIKALIKKAKANYGLRCGLKEAVRTLEHGNAKLCLLAKSCDEPRYTELIQSLCKEHKVNIIQVEKGDDLAQWCGLCKIDEEGIVEKTINCSCVVISSLGDQTCTETKELNYGSSLTTAF